MNCSRRLQLYFFATLVSGCLLAQPAMAQKGKKPPSLALTVTLNSASMEAGTTIFGTVAHNNTDPSAAVSAILSVSDTQAASVEPTTLTIPAGVKSANFNVSALAASPSVTITANASGYASGSATLTITASANLGFTYQLIWLTPANSEGATCQDINNSGVAAGFWQRDGAGAFLWDPVLGIIDLNQLIQSETHYFVAARGINDSGCVAGWARLRTSEEGSVVWQLFRYYYKPDYANPGNLSTDFELVDFFVTPNVSSHMRVNNFGDIGLKGSVDHVLVFSQVGSQDPEYTPESYYVPGLHSVFGLNDSNQILVSASNATGASDCIRLSRNTPDDDLVIPGAWAKGLNNNGDIVGEFWFTRSTPSDHFRYSEIDGAYTILSTASGTPLAINSVGDVCGIFGKSLSRNKLYWAPYLYHDTYGFIDVETLLPGGGDEQWKLARGYDAAANNITYDINDKGVILGRVKTAAGRTAPYVLVPVPTQEVTHESSTQSSGGPGSDNQPTRRQSNRFQLIAKIMKSVNTGV